MRRILQDVNEIIRAPEGASSLFLCFADYAPVENKLQEMNFLATEVKVIFISDTPAQQQANGPKIALPIIDGRRG